MAKNKNLTKQALYYWDEDLKEWRPANFNFDVNGGLVVSSYQANPLFIRSGLSLKPYDYLSRSLAGDNITETWTFRSGGSSGGVTNTVVIVYTDSTLETISTVTKT